MSATGAAATHARYADVPALLQALRKLPPERPALTFYKGKTLAGRWTYGELLAAVDRFTRRLAGDLGVRGGDRVAVLAANRLEVPALFLAAMQLGAAVVPLNPTTPPADWDYILAHSEARLVFGARELLDRLVRRPDAVCAFEDEPTAVDGAAPTPPLTTGPLDRQLAIVLYTSGTTGNPKGVALGQASLLANAWSMAENFQFQGGTETQLAVLPLYHAHALGFGLMTTLTTGGHLVFMERFDPFAWGAVVRAESVTLSSVVPTLLQPLLQIGVRADKLPTLRALLVSSAPLTASLARAFEEKTGLRLVQGWGLSEYTNFACCLPLDLPEDERRQLLHGAELTSIGGPLSGTEVKVVGPDGASLAAGERGELWVRGHSTMLSYFRDDAATAATLGADGWLRTGDEGFFRATSRGPAFSITGRIKETIIRDGDKFSPLAIERRILADVPEIEGRMVALGFPHDLHGEEIGLYLEGETLADDLRARLTKVVGEMPLDARPKVIAFGAAPIPRTHTGKIQRRKLHAAFAPFRDCRGALRIERVD
ncbi:MAG TPA: class I adenylate-forming enzyme family protein [Polyangia bacterium]|nr:class I adenylate-forming enzyme family protein [Polyangia bacterium]